LKNVEDVLIATECITSLWYVRISICMLLKIKPC